MTENMYQEQERFATHETAWCPGCGNFSILACAAQVLRESDLDPHNVVLAAGIGQASKQPQYIRANSFCGLHGRSMPVAQAIALSNPELTVIVDGGDGDIYGEGGNHFMHSIRRNVNLTLIVHDNQVYGLTKGQSSPTSLDGYVTGVQVDGNQNTPMNPLAVAIAAGAGFVARSFTGDQEQLKALMKTAIEYKGFALIDVMQPCVTFNKVNTFQWYKERCYHLEDDYDPTDKVKAFERAQEFGDKIPTGILYYNEKPDYYARNPVLQKIKRLTDVSVEDRVAVTHSLMDQFNVGAKVSQSKEPAGQGKEGDENKPEN